MYHKSYYFSGTKDLLLYDTVEQSLVTADYKTNQEDLFKNFKGRTLLFPFDTMFEDSYNKYQIQLCLYQILIEQLRIPVTERWLIWLMTDGTYKKFQTFDLTLELKQWLHKKTFFTQDLN